MGGGQRGRDLQSTVTLPQRSQSQSLGKLKQELRLHQGLSCGAEPEDLSLLLSQAYYLGVSSKVEQLGIQPAPKWDASLTDRIFTHCVTTLASDPVI